MALGGVVHDRVVAGDDPIQQPGIADVAHDELHAVGGQPRDVLGVAGVGQLVQDGHVHVRVVVHDVVHEVAADGHPLAPFLLRAIPAKALFNTCAIVSIATVAASTSVSFGSTSPFVTSPR